MDSSHQEEECVLCCQENIEIYALGKCDHPVCYQCSTRMRVLCETNDCPICRSDMPLVVFTHEIQPFADVRNKYKFFDRRYKITFENDSIQKKFEELLENRCGKCENVFSTFEKLATHNRRTHELHYCDICTDSLKIFVFERQSYSRADLARHKRGKPERSYEGHPLCEFCDQRYVDHDDLYRHLRREHYFCHFCDADGNRNQFYKDYPFLRLHFMKDHFLCEEGDCRNEKFTAAFRTEIDLKAHIAVTHSKNKSKAEVRQARTLDFEFAYVPHVRPSGNTSPRSNRYGGRRKKDEDSSRNNEVSARAEVEKIDIQSVQDFPCLSENAVSLGTAAAPQSSTAKQQALSLDRNPYPQRRNNIMSPDDFPALGPTPADTASNQFRNLELNSLCSNTASLKAPTTQKRPAKAPERSGQAKLNTKWKSSPANFEEDFPRLESKKKSKPLTTSVLSSVGAVVSGTISKGSTTILNSTASYAEPASLTSSVKSMAIKDPESGEPFLVIKTRKAKKKKKKTPLQDEHDDDDNNDEEEDELKSLPINNDVEVDDKYKKYLVHPMDRQKAPSFEESYNWEEKVSFGTDDFPPLVSSQPPRKPPGFTAPKPSKPPPGFQAKAADTAQPESMSLSSIARLIENESIQSNGVDQEKHPYMKPPNYGARNSTLKDKLNISQFGAFKRASETFRQNEITAEEYYSACLNILGKQKFLDILPELIVLLPDISKQQKLLEVHDGFIGDVKSNPQAKNSRRARECLVSCTSCNQVLTKDDYRNHTLFHERGKS